MSILRIFKRNKERKGEVKRVYFKRNDSGEKLEKHSYKQHPHRHICKWIVID